VTDPSIIAHEADQRFWAQVGYKPGQKLDPNDPTDKAMIPIWLDIQTKVKAEDAAGHLVLTHDHPVVAQNIAEAQAASAVAAQHLDAAAGAPDPAIAQQHMDAAVHHADVASQKTAAAAAVQPPTASPEIAQAASQAVAQQPKHEHKHGHKHVAQAQAEAAGSKVAQAQADAPSSPAPAHVVTPRGILDKETDARFYAQSGTRVGQKLDPNNPTDAKLIPIWMDIFAKVKAEDDAGKLVLTYNNPIVVQKLADAHVADQAAAMHADAAAATSDLHAIQHNLAAASTGAQISAQRTHEAAKLQPPTISPKIAHEAAKAVKRAPPLPPHAPAREHIAHMQAQSAGHRATRVHDHHARHRHPVKSSVHPASLQNYRAQSLQLAHAAGVPFVLVFQHPDGTPDQQTFGSRAELDAAYTQISGQHDQYKYVAAFDLSANPSAPVVDSVGTSAAEHVEQGAAPAPGPGEAHHHHHREQAGAVEAETPKSGWSTGQKVAAAVTAIAVAGGLVYMATRKPSRSPPPSRAPMAIDRAKALRP
jgi:hypothetical protein